MTASIKEAFEAARQLDDVDAMLTAASQEQNDA